MNDTPPTIGFEQIEIIILNEEQQLLAAVFL